MTVTISPSINFTANETIDADGSSDPTVSNNAFNLSGVTLNATSVPKAELAGYETHALTAGAKTIDLTALVGANGKVQDGTGKKAVTLVVQNPAGNDAITIAQGAANPYPIFGASGSLEVPPGASMGIYFGDNLPLVSATVKTIDVSGTGTEQFNLGIVLG